MFKKILKFLEVNKKKYLENELHKDACHSCIYFGEEEMYNKSFHRNKKKRYCSQLDKYMHKNSSCEFYSKELFEATENSTQTKEYNLDFEFDIREIEDREDYTENESK